MKNTSIKTMLILLIFCGLFIGSACSKNDDPEDKPSVIADYRHFTSFKDFNSVMKGSNTQFDMISRPGGAGLVAMKEFLSAKDKKTLIWVGASLSVANSVLKKNPEYSRDDYRPVVLASKAALLFVKSPLIYFDTNGL